jgi:predicted secreted protein
MATAGVINGTNLLVYVNGTAIAGSKSCKLTTSHEVRDTTTKGSAGWNEVMEGKRKWGLSVDGLVALDATTTAWDDLYTLLIVNRTKVHLKFSNETSGDAWWYGDGYCDALDMDTPVEDSTSYSASFSGTGVLTQATHT